MPTNIRNSLFFFIVGSLDVSARGTGPADWLIHESHTRAFYVNDVHHLAVGNAKRVIKGFKKRKGPEHPDIVLVLKDLAFLYYIKERYAEAEQLYKEGQGFRSSIESLGEKVRKNEYYSHSFG